MPVGLGSALEIRAFFSKNCTLHRTDLQTDAAVDAGIEINPVELGTFLVAALACLDAGDRTRIKAIGDAFADIGHDCVGHGALRATLILVSR